MNEASDGATADGGPLDGQRIDVDDDVEDVVVTMADGTRHRYVRTAGSPGAVLQWSGRI